MSTKPVVSYLPSKYDVIKVGVPAFVFPMDHPSELVSNTQMIQTSTVVAYDKIDGSFETQNTRYQVYRGQNHDNHK